MSPLVLFLYLVFSKVSAWCPCCLKEKNACGRPLREADEKHVFFLSSPRKDDSENYPANARCSWTIKAPPGKVVRLKFVTFDTYGTPTCDLPSDDTLKIYDESWSYKKSLIAKYCGRNLPGDLVSSQTHIHLVFESNDWTNSLKKGFRIEYKAVSPITFHQTSSCSPLKKRIDNTDLKMQASSSKKYIKSPLYPNRYPSNSECVWTIKASSYGKKIKLTWNKVDISNIWKINYSCDHSSNVDVITVHDGLLGEAYSPIIQTICAPLYSPITVTSSQDTLKIRFKSNLDNFFPDATAGFEAEFIEFDDGNSSNNSLWIMGLVIGLIILTSVTFSCAYIRKRRKQANTLPTDEAQQQSEEGHQRLISQHSPDQTPSVQPTDTQPADQENSPSNYNQENGHVPDVPYDDPPPAYPGLPSYPDLPSTPDLLSYPELPSYPGLPTTPAQAQSLTDSQPNPPNTSLESHNNQQPPQTEQEQSIVRNNPQC